MARTAVKSTRGAAMMELALLSPWIIFLFIGALDWGVYSYSLITLETATRAAATYAASSSSYYLNTTTICGILTSELSSLGNMNNVTTCTGGSPVSFTSTSITGPDNNGAIQVSVTYATPPLIPIPALLAKQFTIT